MLVAAGLLFVAGPAAFAQDDNEAGFVIRQIDGTNPDKVGVTFVWNGDRAELEEMTLREDGRLAPTDPPVPLARAGIKRSLVIVLDKSASMTSEAPSRRPRKGSPISSRASVRTRRLRSSPSTRTSTSSRR